MRAPSGSPIASRREGRKLAVGRAGGGSCGSSGDDDDDESGHGNRPPPSLPATKRSSGAKRRQPSTSDTLLFPPLLFLLLLTASPSLQSRRLLIRVQSTLDRRCRSRSLSLSPVLFASCSSRFRLSPFSYSLFFSRQFISPSPLPLTRRRAALSGAGF